MTLRLLSIAAFVALVLPGFICCARAQAAPPALALAGEGSANPTPTPNPNAGANAAAVAEVAICVIEDFTDPADNPQLTMELAASLVGLAKDRRVLLTYRVVEEKADAQGIQVLLEPFRKTIPEMPEKNLHLREYQEKSAEFQTKMTAWRKDYKVWREKQAEAAQGWARAALDKQMETSARFAREMAKRKTDYRRSSIASALVYAAAADFPAGCTGFAVLLSDLKDEPGEGRARKSAVTELPPHITLILTNPGAAASVLIAGLPNPKKQTEDLAAAAVLAAEELNQPRPATAAAEQKENKTAPPGGNAR